MCLAESQLVAVYAVYIQKKLLSYEQMVSNVIDLMRSTRCKCTIFYVIIDKIIKEMSNLLRLS